MIKTYKANTNISINVVLASKKNLHVSFVPLSNGSSVFTTDREEVQNAIESHYKFGKLFVLASTQGQPNKDTPKKSDGKKDTPKNETPTVDTTKGNDTPIDENINADLNNEDTGENDADEGNSENEETENNAETETDNDLKKVTVTDIASAKDYLADKCGVSRTIMRSTKSIMEQAMANGIEFVGI